MCVVIDTNVVSTVFDSKNEKHADFKPVLRSLLSTKSKSKFIYGGTKYLEEVNSFRKHLPTLALLNQLGKTKRLNNQEVDDKHHAIEQVLLSRGHDIVNDDRYNDSHILAMVLVGEAKIVTTKDFKSIPLIRTKEFYQHISHIPSFYTSIRNTPLFNNPIYFQNCCSK